MIHVATAEDSAGILQLDRHIQPDRLAKKITDGEVYVLKFGAEVAGTLRYSWFWDNTPFMNLLYLQLAYQRQGWGRQLVVHWEQQMAAAGYDTVLTSTLANEPAQHFYRRLGYRDIGGFVLPDEPLELVLMKSLAH